MAKSQPSGSIASTAVRPTAVVVVSERARGSLVEAVSYKVSAKNSQATSMDARVKPGSELSNNPNNSNSPMDE